MLHYGLSPICGGIERSLDRLWTNIDKDIFQFDFIDEWNGRAYYREKFEAMGAKFFTIPSRRESVINNIKAWNSIPKDKYPDILHCHMNTLSYVYPLYWAMDRGIPVLLHSRSSGMKGSSITYVLHSINKIRLKRKNINRIAVSQEAGKWLFGEKSSFITIHNGIDKKKFVFSEQNRYLVRRELNIDENTFLIGAVGHLSVEKNIPFMLNIIDSIKEKKKECKLMIVGDGCLKDNVVQYINNKNLAKQVLLLGHVDNSERYYSAMDLYIMPSIREGFPNAALEAQANGLHCLLSNTITREVDGGLCKFLPIIAGTEGWVSEIMGFMEANDKKRESSFGVDAFSIENELEYFRELYLCIYKDKKEIGI